MKHYLGIDVSADALDFCLLNPSGGVELSGTQPNTVKGIGKLVGQLPDPLNTCVVFESTGVYGRRLGDALPGKVGMACEVNPKLVKNAATTMTQTKTDALDAKAIAGAARCLGLTNPIVLKRSMITGKENSDLQVWLKEYDRRRRAIVRIGRQLDAVSRTPGAAAKEVAIELKEEIDRLRVAKKRARKKVEELAAGEDFELLKSIKGIGSLTAAALSQKIVDIERFDSADEFKSYFGLYPRRRESGKRKGQMRIAKHGDALVRDLLWNCAKPAAVRNPACRALYERLREKGKPAPYAWAAVARKLVQIVYGVLKSRTQWDATMGVPYPLPDVPALESGAML